MRTGRTHEKPQTSSKKASFHGFLATCFSASSFTLFANSTDSSPGGITV